MKLLTFSTDTTDDVIELFTQSFGDAEGEAEGKVIGHLVSELIVTTPTADLQGFMASIEGKIVGSIFFSRLTLANDINAFILSPVAVSTAYQAKGIGQQLINFGLKQLKDNGVELVFTYGDPNYYVKVGFNPISEDCIKAPLVLTYPEGWLAQSLVGAEIEPIEGDSFCVDALNEQLYW
ncbi:N-acetyltransferase [Shewanella olleyana]|uniref:GNAT family N-acetyltransferase n=1 Tax=Shewanella olleyana TaxID=135626 RepID=UPI00200F02D9|nr:N-acetyltransferase [Shewanella olleyana]MCL1068627.1 N-acetyltransferase [Shewanella olleyana]